MSTLWPLVEAIFHLRPVRSDNDAVHHKHPADDAERVRIAEPRPDVLVIAIPKSLVGQRTYHTQRSPSVRAVAYRDGPLLIKGVRRAIEVSDVLLEHIVFPGVVQYGGEESTLFSFPDFEAAGRRVVAPVHLMYR